MWDEVAEIVSKDFPDVKWDKMLVSVILLIKSSKCSDFNDLKVDAMTVRMVAKPTSLDTIVTTNLHGE